MAAMIRSVPSARASRSRRPVGWYGSENGSPNRIRTRDRRGKRRPPSRMRCVPLTPAGTSGALIALLARFSIAATFWNSGQTKVEGFALNIVSGEFAFGWPRLSSSAVDLFRDEYKLPLLPPELAAVMAVTGEHVLPLLVLLGLGTRLASFGLLVMTAVIQFLVYPDAWPTHLTWAVPLFYLIGRGGGAWTLDQRLGIR